MRLLGHVLGLQHNVTGEVPIAALLTVRELLRVALAQLALPFAEPLDRLWDEYAVLVNGRDIRHLEGWETRVAPGSTVSVVSPAAGG